MIRYSVKKRSLWKDNEKRGKKEKHFYSEEGKRENDVVEQENSEIKQIY